MSTMVIRNTIIGRTRDPRCTYVLKRTRRHFVGIDDTFPPIHVRSSFEQYTIVVNAHWLLSYSGAGMAGLGTDGLQGVPGRATNSKSSRMNTLAATNKSNPEFTDTVPLLIPHILRPCVVFNLHTSDRSRVVLKGDNIFIPFTPFWLPLFRYIPGIKLMEKIRELRVNRPLPVVPVICIIFQNYRAGKIGSLGPKNSAKPSLSFSLAKFREKDARTSTS